MCFGFSTLDAGAKPRLESRILKFAPYFLQASHFAKFSSSKKGSTMSAKDIVHFYKKEQGGAIPLADAQRIVDR